MKEKIDGEKYFELEYSIWNEFLNTASQEELYHSLMSSNCMIMNIF